MFSFELSSIIFKVFFADFEHVFVCWGRYRVTVAVLRIIEKPYPAKKFVLKVSNRNPKTRCEIYVVETYRSNVIGLFIWGLLETSHPRDVVWDVVDTYQWNVLVTYHWDVVECFIWDWCETWRTDGNSLLRPLKTSSRRFNKMSGRRTIKTSWHLDV